MASKPKGSKTFIVHHRASNTIVGRYKVGAKNEKEAESFLRVHVGKHAKVKVYYEETKSLVPHKTVLREC